VTTEPPPSKSRRDSILDEATRLFAERGYEGASMADLADSVGLRKASLFHHFPSKDLLYAAVLERLLMQFGELITISASKEGTYAERLEHLTDAILATVSEDPYAARLVIREMMDWGPFAQQRFQEIARPVLDAAETFFNAGQRDGAFIQQDTKHLLLSLIGMHFIPFSLHHVVKEFTGDDAFSPDWVSTRRRVLHEEVRALVLVR